MTDDSSGVVAEADADWGVDSKEEEEEEEFGSVVDDAESASDSQLGPSSASLTFLLISFISAGCSNLSAFSLSQSE